MVTSALVLTLSADASVQRAALDTLEGDARLILGQAVGTRLPVVAETSGLAAAEMLAEELLAIAGVLLVDVVLVDFDPHADIDVLPRLGKGRRAREEDTHGPA